MALFMVLWISAQDKKILLATSRYFQNPFHSPMEATSGVLPFNSNKSTQSSGDNQGAEKSDARKQVEITFLNTVASELSRLLHMENTQTENPFDVQVTSDGLRVTLFDRAKKPLFIGNTAEFSEWGKFVMQNMSWIIDRHHFRVTIDGHTKRNLELGREDYSPWELSVDRANAARRSLVLYAVDAALIERVTGYAGTKPLQGQDPDDESNQRITLSLSLSRSPDANDARAAAAKPAGRTLASQTSP